MEAFVNGNICMMHISFFTTHKECHCKMIRKYQVLLILMTFLTVLVTFSIKTADNNGKPKLKSECSLNNHLYEKVLKRREINVKMTPTKPKSCGNVSFSKIALPTTVLVSFQGSGNTWLRHLIQEATGNI